jgi:hypothetical protein
MSGYCHRCLIYKELGGVVVSNAMYMRVCVDCAQIARVLELMRIGIIGLIRVKELEKP